jgi:hypothetical protein
LNIPLIGGKVAPRYIGNLVEPVILIISMKQVIIQPEICFMYVEKVWIG